MRQKECRIIIVVVATVFLFLLNACGAKVTLIPEKPIVTVLPTVTHDLQKTHEYAELPKNVSEVDILEIPLPAPLDKPNAEISGMDWYGDKLVILPQYPDRFVVDNFGSLFYINKSDIIAFIENPPYSPVTIQRIPFDQAGIQDDLAGFEGFEAIAFYEDHFYVTVETKPGINMKGYIYQGEVKDNLSLLTIDADTYQEIRPQVKYINASDEAMLIFNQKVVTFFEDYGENKNNDPLVHVFSLDLREIVTIPMPHIEYRLTDVTRADSDGNFWAMNYFFPGDEHLLPSRDPIAEVYGEGPTHQLYEPVERLVKFHIDENGITLLDQEPVQFALLPDDEARNWEGLAMLEGYGFLVATDKFPSTILGFCEILR